ncbi:hypothetical protein Tco_0691305 [Tanacetum coccineum]
MEILAYSPFLALSLPTAPLSSSTSAMSNFTYTISLSSEYTSSSSHLTRTEECQFSLDFVVFGFKVFVGPQFRFVLLRGTDELRLRIALVGPLECDIRYGYIKNYKITVKTGKHEHKERNSTKEAKDSKPKPRKVNNGQASIKESQTLAKKSQPIKDKNSKCFKSTLQASESYHIGP